MGRSDLKQHDGKMESSRRAALGRRFGTNWILEADLLASYPSEHGSSERGDSAPRRLLLSDLWNF